jgi:hypothetical protein
MNPYNHKNPEASKPTASHGKAWRSRFSLSVTGSARRRQIIIHPITETGYRSHFLSPDEIEAVGGVFAYVVDALDEAAKRKEWKARQAAQRQLSLF